MDESYIQTWICVGNELAGMAYVGMDLEPTYTDDHKWFMYGMDLEPTYRYVRIRISMSGICIMQAMHLLLIQID